MPPSPITTPYLSSTRARRRSRRLACRRCSPTRHPPARSLVIDGRATDLADLILDLELGNRLTIQDERSGTTGDFFVEQLALAVVAPGRLSGSYALSSASSKTTVLFVAANDADTA
jgi:hypothetical protein